MKRGFTLVELLLVMGLMALMGAMAIGGYAAITRGMNDRAALDAAKSILDAAEQRAKVDQTDMYVYTFNEVLKTENERSTSPGIVSGVAVAVMPVGRITFDDGNGVYCDEFGPINDIPVNANSKSKNGSGPQVNEELEDDDDSIIETKLYKIGSEECALMKAGSITDTSAVKLDDNGNKLGAWAWKIRGYTAVEGGKSINFNVGDLYGVEFAVVRLPPNYVFEGAINLGKLGQSFSGFQSVSPNGNANPLKILFRRPDGSFKSIGDTSQIKDGDNQ